MREGVKRVLVAVALGLLVAAVVNRLDAEFTRLGISPDSTLLDDLIVGLVAALCTYAWASFLSERHSRHLSSEKLRQEGVLRERMRIACEIHDTLGQGFAGMIINLEAAGEFLGECPGAQKFSERALRIGRESLAEARSMLQGLRSPTYEGENLRETVTRLVETLTADAHVRVNCTVEEIVSLLSPDAETHLLRIIREAVTNIVRHAKATEVRITLRVNSEQIQLCVEDDGCGFVPADHLHGESFGLTSMRERARNLGGFFSLYSQPGSGTRVVVFVPIPGESGSRSKGCEVTTPSES